MRVASIGLALVLVLLQLLVAAQTTESDDNAAAAGKVVLIEQGADVTDEELLRAEREDDEERFGDDDDEAEEEEDDDDDDDDGEEEDEYDGDEEEGADRRDLAQKKKNKNNNNANRPNLVLILTDDYGWANIGYHRETPTDEVQTPNMDELAGKGVKLERFYTYNKCSPSRSALQTGRYSMHVNVENASPEAFNREDRVSGYGGVPLKMTTLGQKLKNRGYHTTFVGKWDLGMVTPKHLPINRGYDKSLFYFGHGIDYHNCGVPITAIGEINVCKNRFTDLWFNNKPGKKLCNRYVEDVFADYAILQMKQAKKKKKPLFLFYSSHLVHTPLQVPHKYSQKFAFIDNLQRRQLAAMVNYLDMVIGRIVKALKNHNMYKNTLILFLSDNGGAIYTSGGGNSYPLRAGKYADFEGGVRVNAFASGGVIPKERRGTISERYVHIADVYASFLRLAWFGPNKVDIDEAELQKRTKDPRAEKAGLPQPDSQDTLWPAILDAPQNIRDEVWLSANALIMGQYKLVTGVQPQDIWQGPQFPNATGPQPNPNNKDYLTDCGRGCLFNIFEDPSEYNDLASKESARVNAMVQRLAELNTTLFLPYRGEDSPKACVVAKNKYKGNYGPFIFKYK